MNKSGEAVKKICDFYKILPEDILVLHDEIDLPTGKIQKKIGGSHA
jgi:peptidyl-tRNA hydrolase, PTH1 family